MFAIVLLVLVAPPGLGAESDVTALRPPEERAAESETVELRVPLPPGADVQPIAVRPLGLSDERCLPPSISVSETKSAVPKLSGFVVREPASLPSGGVERAVNRMIYAALTDGSANPRVREWRRPLVRMLADESVGADFDRVYGFLLRSFGGNDDRTKIRALAKWAEETLPPCEAAEVCRAETRYWLNLGDAAMTADAAGRMERARPDYAARACRLRATSYATAGELEKAKGEIARSRKDLELSTGDRLEFDYLEAWIALQEGDVPAARSNLQAIVAMNPKSAAARKASSVLASIAEEGER